MPNFRASAWNLHAMEDQFRRGQVAEGDIKYMKQRMYDTHRSRSSSKGRIGRTGRE